jgi:ribosomal-protein-alanine N-acetyltransferase
MEYFLRSSRLGFRCWTENDVAFAVALWGDERVTTMIGGPFTAEQIKARLASEIANMQQHAVQYWPIFLLQGDEHAGCAGLRPYRPQERIYELGVHLRPKFWGEGLATEAGRAVIDYGFGDLKTSALFAGHNPRNDMSKRFLLKLGFIYTHDELYSPTGLMHPSYILRAETRPGEADRKR